MGLKVFSSFFNSVSGNPDKIRPKWDWKTITLAHPLFSHSDKIRPKWDWKVIKFLSCHETGFKIKSDQNGIERRLQSRWRTGHSRDKIRPKWDWKKTSFSSKLSSVPVDKIRPKWDWKTIAAILANSFCETIKSDQNGIESPKILASITEPKSDKIRPKWDWKEPSHRRREAKRLPIKSDQNGIESLFALS